MPETLAAELFLGIDGGGSKCSAIIADAQGTILGRGMGGSANAYQNLLQTQASILTASHRALQDAGLSAQALPQLTAGVGLAGLNVPSVHAAMTQWQHPFKKIHLTTDLHIACLGAHQGAEGAVIIAGTGSCGYSFVKNKTLLLGGHGFLLGDNGSGAWMGLAAVKAVLLALDDAGPATLLTQLLCEELATSETMIVDQLSAATSGDYAKLSRLVFLAAQQQDDVARAIIGEGARYLDRIAEKLWQAGPGRMSLIGGLSSHIAPWLAPSVAARLSPALAQPEVGAVLFARQQ